MINQQQELKLTRVKIGTKNRECSFKVGHQKQGLGLLMQTLHIAPWENIGPFSQGAMWTVCISRVGLGKPNICVNCEYSVTTFNT